MKMKRLIVFSAFLFCAPALAQISAEKNVQKIDKLSLKKRQKYTFQGRDSLATIVIDTLVMGDRASIAFPGKKALNLIIKYASIGQGCVFIGDDGKNNGTNLTLSANFARLKSLAIEVPGLDAKMSNRKYDNGDGGKVEINYLAGGVKPQMADPAKEGYIEVNTRAGGYLTNAQTDLYAVYSRLNSGVPGRPLSQLPNGRVFSGGLGRAGKADLQEVASLTHGSGPGTSRKEM